MVLFLQTMALMTTSIQKYKFYEQVRAEHLNHLAQARNENKAIREEVKAIIGDHEGKLKWLEESHTSITTKATEQETHIKDLTAFLWDSKKDVHWARDELGHKRNRHIRIEDNFNISLESSVKKSIADALEKAHLKAEVERERKKMRRWWKRPSRQPWPNIWPRTLLGSWGSTASRKGLMNSGI